MKTMLCAAAAIAAAYATPSRALAADLYGYEVRGVVVEDDPPVVVERERIIERRYYAPGYREAPPPADVYEERAYRPAYYPDRRYWRTYDGW